MHFQLHQNRIIENGLKIIQLEKNKIIEHISYPLRVGYIFVHYQYL